MALTNSWLNEQLGEAADRVREVADGAGLSVRISCRGKVVFQMRYQWMGIAQRLDVGVYPAMSLASAREQNRRLRQALDNGHDPREVLLAEQRARVGAGETIELLLRAWCRSLRGARSNPDFVRQFETHLFLLLGAESVDGARLGSWIQALTKVAVEEPAIAVSLFTLSKRALSWAKAVRLVHRNVLSPMRTSAFKYYLEVAQRRPQTLSMVAEKVSKASAGKTGQ